MLDSCNMISTNSILYYTKCEKSNIPTTDEFEILFRNLFKITDGKHITDNLYNLLEYNADIFK